VEEKGEKEIVSWLLFVSFASEARKDAKISHRLAAVASVQGGDSLSLLLAL